MCCPVISWFARLAQAAPGETESLEIDDVTAMAIEKIREKLTELGTVGKRFEQEAAKTLNDLQATNYKHFHRGLKVLGEMLGFSAEIPAGSGAPDCLWSIGSEIYVVHEAKSDHTPDNPIGINDIRQAQSHEDWVRKHCTCDGNTQILPVIESPRTVVSNEAVVYAKSLCHVVPEQMKTICEKITAVLRKVRASASDLSDEKVLENLYSEVTAAKLTPHDIVTTLSENPVTEMPKT
jgi:hypothetical protein